MNTTKMSINGVVVGGIVAILSIAFIFGAWSIIEQRTVDTGYAEDGTMTDWMIRWGIIAITIGLAADLIFPYLSAKMQWTNRRYLVFSVLLMIILDLLVFLPIYDSSVRVYPVAYIGLNTIFFIGFGALVPRLSEGYERRLIH